MNAERQRRMTELRIRQFAKTSEEQRQLLFLQAFGEDNLELIRVYLETGLKLDFFNFNGRSMLDSTLAPFKRELWELLLEFWIPFPDKALVKAAIHGYPNVEGVKFLLAHGVGGKDEALLDPIIVGGGSEDILRVLLQNKANPNVKDEEGATPLMVGAHYWDESKKSMHLLLEFGADSQVTDNKGNSVLEYAGTDAKSVERFLNRYAKNPRHS